MAKNPFETDTLLKIEIADLRSLTPNQKQMDHVLLAVYGYSAHFVAALQDCLPQGNYDVTGQSKHGVVVMHRRAFWV